jgi:hypothetical protein
MYVLLKGGNVFEIGITLPGRADVSLAEAMAYRLQLRGSFGELGFWKSIHKRARHGMGICLVSECDSATTICGKTLITDIIVLR